MSARVQPDPELPADGTVERWAFDYVRSCDLRTKLAPPPPPRDFEPSPTARRLASPGRPPELACVPKSAKAPKSLREPEHRARVLHTFLHHELQAAELMAWAILAFPSAPRALKMGWLGVCQDEIRHMAMYGERLDALGYRFGQYPITDWFWRRIPQSESIADFVASIGIGFEGGNLDHAARFAERFRDVGDLEGARVQDRVREEEIPHVRLAIHWFRERTGGLDFDAWRAHLPVPLSPTVMRGPELNLEARARAGYDVAFLERLSAWDPDASGR